MWREKNDEKCHRRCQTETGPERTNFNKSNKMNIPTRHPYPLPPLSPRNPGVRFASFMDSSTAKAAASCSENWLGMANWPYWSSKHFSPATIIGISRHIFVWYILSCYFCWCLFLPSWHPLQHQPPQQLWLRRSSRHQRCWENSRKFSSISKCQSDKYQGASRQKLYIRCITQELMKWQKDFSCSIHVIPSFPTIGPSSKRSKAPFHPIQGGFKPWPKIQNRHPKCPVNIPITLWGVKRLVIPWLVMHWCQPNH